MTSEFGVHGVYKSKTGNWSVMTITGQNDVIVGRNSVDTTLKAHFDDDVLMIGRSFYILRNGQFTSAVDLVNQSHVTPRTTNQRLAINSYNQIAYAARHNQILTVGIDGIDLIDLEFTDQPNTSPQPPPPQPPRPSSTMSSSTTSTTAAAASNNNNSTVQTTTVNSEKMTNSKLGLKHCPDDEIDGIRWSSTRGDTWTRVNCRQRYCNRNGAWERPDTSQCAQSEYAEFPGPIRSALESMALAQTLHELSRQLGSEENNEQRVNLVERVSSVLMTFESSYEMDDNAKQV